MILLFTILSLWLWGLLLPLGKYVVSDGQRSWLFCRVKSILEVVLVATRRVGCDDLGLVDFVVSATSTSRGDRHDRVLACVLGSGTARWRGWWVRRAGEVLHGRICYIGFGLLRVLRNVDGLGPLLPLALLNLYRGLHLLSTLFPGSIGWLSILRRWNATRPQFNHALCICQLLSLTSVNHALAMLSWISSIATLVCNKLIQQVLDLIRDISRGFFIRTGFFRSTLRTLLPLVLGKAGWGRFLVQSWGIMRLGNDYWWTTCGFKVWGALIVATLS